MDHQVGKCKILYFLILAWVLALLAVPFAAAAGGDAVGDAGVGEGTAVVDTASRAANTESGTGQSERVVLRAEGSLQILAGGDEIIAQDGVQVEYRDMVIYADRLYYVLGENSAYFSGHVQIYQGDQYLEGESLEYDFKHQQAKISDASAVVIGQGLKGELYVRGESIETEGDDIFIHGGSVTTCDLEHPHFHLQAGEIEIYPGDKIIVRRVSYWEGSIPLFYWPYLVLPLGRESAFEMPRIGYSNSEGWFVKTAYNYYRNTESYGTVHLDYMQKKGIGTGVDHTYYDRGSTGKGEISVYRLQNPADGTTTWEGSWQQSLELKPEVRLEMGTEYFLQPGAGSAEDQWELEPAIKLSRRGQGEAYTVQLAHWRSQEGDSTAETELDWTYRRRLGDRWQLSSSGHSLAAGSEGEVESYIMYQHTLQRLAASNQFTLKVEQEVHPAARGSTQYSSYDWKTLRRMPELTWESRGWSLLGGRLPAQLTAGAGRYLETYPDGDALEGNKLSLKGGITTRRYALSPTAYFVYDGSIELDSYRGLTSYIDMGDGEPTLETPMEDMSRAVIISRPRLVLQPIQPLTLDFSYKDQWVLGSSPFVFDKLENSETLSGRITWRTPTFGASLGTGYDFWSGTFNDLVGQVHLRPSERYEVNVWASYDLEADTWKSARGMISLMPRDDIFLRIASSYSFTYDKWDGLDGQLQITLPNRWRFEYVIGYSGVQEEWTKHSAMLALDLHCRELRLRYDQLNDTVWLEYSINALPQTRLTVQRGDEFDVNVEGLADLVTQLSQGN